MPQWTYAKLKAADIAIGSPVDITAAATTLNAQTTTLTNQMFLWGDARMIAVKSDNFSWPRIMQRIKQTALIPPVTSMDAAILAAINAVELPLAQPIDPTSPGWAKLMAGMSALQAVGDLSAADIAAIQALTSPVVPTWQPAVDVGHIQTARAQP